MWSRLRTWIGRPPAERDLHDEMEFHWRARTEYWTAQGLPPDEAARRARLEFGGAEGYKEVCREARRPRLIREFGADLVYAWRRMRASPMFSIVAIALLALAIAANTAVFNVLEAVMFRTLPVERPHDLRELAWTSSRQHGWKMTYDGSMRPFDGGELLATSFSYPVYTHLRDRSTAFSDLFLFTGDEINLGIAGREHRVSVLLVSGNFLDGLGVTMRSGRGITPEDDRESAAPVVVLTSRVWHRLFGADPAVLGSTVAINGVPTIVAGIAPSAFEGLEPGRPVDVLAPITSVLPIVEKAPNRFGETRWAFQVMGRLRPGADAQGARAEAETLFRQAAPTPRAYEPRLLVRPGGQGLDSLRRNYAEPLNLLMAIMAAVLLIACANITGLLLMRAASREREMSVRLALGAGRWRLIRQLLTESALLALIAGIVGTAVALAVSDGLLPLLNQDEEPIEIALGSGAWVLAFSGTLCLAVGFLCGILPALRATRRGARLTTTRALPGGAGESSRFLTGKSLIAVQVALSLVLLVGAGLFVRTLVNLRSEPLGFQPDQVLLFQMDATDAGYSGARLHDFYERMLERVGAIPGVQAVSMSRYGLISGGATRDTIVIPEAPPGQNEVGTHVHFVSAKHLETLGIQLAAGRDLAPQDREGAARVALVNQALARALPGGGPAVGRFIAYDDPKDRIEIVGVAADARFATLRDPAPPTIYLPYRQHSQHRMTFAVRTAGDPLDVVGAVREAGEAVDPKVPVYEIRTQLAQIDDALRQERLFAYVASGFALLAVLLACLGIYATLGYAVARRTSEIGLRIALGASRREVISMVLRESLLPVIVGVGVGLAAAWVTVGVLEEQLFGLVPHDRPTLALATAALVVSALVAAWFPSRRASAVDPMTALRAE